MSAGLEKCYEVFFEECLELLAEMETCLLGLDVSSPDQEDLNAIFRAAHSIKGGAGIFGFTDMMEMTHELETLLDKLRKGELEVESEMIDTFLKAGDAIKDQLAGHFGDRGADPAIAASICKELKVFEENGGGNTVFADNGTCALEEGEKKAEIDFGFFSSAPAAPEESGGVGGKPQDVLASGKQLADTENKAISVVKAKDTGKLATGFGETSIRVSVEKVDQMINIIGELVNTRTMLSQTVSQDDSVIYEKLLGNLNQVERNTRNLQELVMSIRMMPISFLFSRYPRVVRDLASKLNKKIELKTVGEGIEFDKGLIEKITDPITHLVRNSIDHGIELPEKRLAASKPEQGTITLSAFHQGGCTVIEVSDDGVGLNREKILEKAKEQSLTVSDSMTDQEVWMLIFEAGFSTADAVTDISGRGVGMDVVKRNITEMGGQIEIDSVFGVGSCISFRFPPTLAILDGLSVAVGEQIFIVPLTSIIELLRPSAGDIKTVCGQGHVVQVRGEYLPVITLHEVFNIPPKVSEIHEGILVILESEGRIAAMFVDALVDQHQVVIKSLENNYRRVQGVSGATIMGDGKVALILDTAALMLSLEHESIK